jgi:TRAP-type C4-dicarboxylate transport system permease small subunit
VLRGLVAAAVFAMMALIFVDVFLRYLFNAPIAGSLEIIQFLLAIVIFAALPLVSASQGHITVGLLEGLFLGQGRRVQKAVVSLISVGALALIASLMVRQGLSAARFQKVTGYLELPLSWLAFAMAGLAAVTALVQAASLWSGLRGGRAPR